MASSTPSNNGQASTDSSKSASASHEQAAGISSATEVSTSSLREDTPTSSNNVDNVLLVEKQREQEFTIALETIIKHFRWPIVLAYVKNELAETRLHVNKNVGNPKNTATMQRTFQGITNWLDDRYSLVAELEIGLRGTSAKPDQEQLGIYAKSLASTLATGLRLLSSFSDTLHEVQNECKVEHEGTEEALFKLREQIQSKETQIQNLNAVLDQQSQQLEQQSIAECQLSQLQTANSTLEAQNAESTSKLSRAPEVLTISAAQELYSIEPTTTQSHFSDLQNTISSLEAQKTDLKSKLAKESRVLTISGAKELHSNEPITTQSQISDLQSIISSLETENAELKSKLGKEPQVLSLSTAEELHSNEPTVNQSQLAHLQTTISTLESQNAELTSKLAKESETQRLKTALDIHSDEQEPMPQSQLSRLQSTISNLETQNTDLATKYAKAVRDESIREDYISTMLDELDRLKEAEGASTALATQAVTEKKSLANELELLRDEYNTYQTQYSVHASESSSTKITALLAEMRGKDREIAGLEGQIDRLRIDAAAETNKLKKAEESMLREKQRGESIATAFGNLQSEVRGLLGDVEIDTLRVIARGGPDMKREEEEGEEKGREKEVRSGEHVPTADLEEDEEHLDDTETTDWAMIGDEEEPVEGEGGPSTWRTGKKKEEAKIKEKGKDTEPHPNPHSQRPRASSTECGTQTSPTTSDPTSSNLPPNSSSLTTLQSSLSFYKSLSTSTLQLARNATEKTLLLEAQITLEKRKKTQGKIAQRMFWMGAFFFFVAAAWYFQEVAVWKGVNGSPEERMRLVLGYGGYY